MHRSKETTPPRIERCLQYMTWGHDVYLEYGIPANLHNGLDMYLMHHIRPGGYLYAVLSNNLKEAMLRWAGTADDNPTGRLVLFCCSEIPAPAWGSVEFVESWINMVNV